MITAGITGLLDLGRTLSSVSKVLKVATAAASHHVADEMVEGMRARVPTETGTLRDSIRAEPADDGGTFVRAGGTPETSRPTKGGTVYDEAVLTEYGTVYEAARPFFNPEVHAARDRHGAEVIQAVNAAVGD